MHQGLKAWPLQIIFLCWLQICRKLNLVRFVPNDLKLKKVHLKGHCSLVKHFSTNSWIICIRNWRDGALIIFSQFITHFADIKWDLVSQGWEREKSFSGKRQKDANAQPSKLGIDSGAISRNEDSEKLNFWVLVG